MRGRTLAAALATCALSSTAGADQVSGTRSDLLVEVSHTVTATVHRGFAELQVRRTVYNGGKRHDQAKFFIDLPPSAVATSLGTLGTLGGRPHWFAGELMEAEAAAAKYRELTGIGGYYPKDPALLSWRHQGLLALQVFPCAPDLEKSVRYTLLVPTRYQNGVHGFVLPGLGTERRLAEVSIRSAKGAGALRIDGRPAATGTLLRTALDREVAIGVVPPQSDPLAGELAVVEFAQRRVLTRFSVEAAPQISKAPKGAYVVIAIDASNSVPDHVIEAQTTAAAAYLSHLPDARVEVLAFDRKVRRRYGAFVDSARARRELTRVPIERKNGSAVDLALHEAEALLAKAPAGRPRRILLLTDGLARSALRPDRLKSTLGKSGAIAHLALLRAGGTSLSRADEHPWAEAPRVTGGLLWNASAPSSPDKDDRKALRETFEEWARPLRIDHFRMYSPDLALGDRERPAETLDEGEGFSDLFIAERKLSWLRIEGELWSRPIHHVLHPDAAAAKRWSALVFGSELLHSLSEPEMAVLANKGGAVSPVTSYLAIEPGVRPSTEGLDWTGEGVGFGSGRAPSIRMGASSVSGRVIPIDRERFIRDALAQSWRGCGGTPGQGHVSFETTKAEVVDVTNVGVGPSKDPLLERCLSEAAWDLALTPHFDEEYNVWSIDV